MQDTWKVWKQGRAWDSCGKSHHPVSSREGGKQVEKSAGAGSFPCALSGYDERVCIIPRAGRAQGKQPWEDAVKGSEPTLLRERPPSHRGPWRQ